MTVRDVWERLRRPVHIRWNRWTSPEETKSCRRNAGRLRDPHGLRKVFAEISVKVERQWRRDDFFFPPAQHALESQRLPDLVLSQSQIFSDVGIAVGLCWLISRKIAVL
jgi:hypothetical protein